MFTGLVEDLATVEAVEEVTAGRRFAIRAAVAASDLTVGDSISINGACQTVVARDGDVFEVIAVPETLRRTNFEALTVGSKVNLERPLRVGDRLGGHWVSGHVDVRGSVDSVPGDGEERAFAISVPSNLAVYIVEKGSISIDGVSLTVGPVEDRSNRCRFLVYIIPETWERTLFGSYRPGDVVNIEVDLLGKYILRSQQLAETKPQNLS